MAATGQKKPFKKIALGLSLAAILVWAILGTGTSLAWFTHTDADVINVFHLADFDLTVSHRLDDGTWEELDGQTKVFSDEALYEPGYVQVVFLKVENTGDRPFLFKTAVSVTDYTIATNAFGQPFNLQDYLLFGLTAADTEAGMDAAVATRDQAVALANLRLNRYSTENAQLDPGGEAYLALIVRMPEEIGNVANYRGDVIPRVELGVIVEATQLNAPNP